MNQFAEALQAFATLMDAFAREVMRCADAFERFLRAFRGPRFLNQHRPRGTKKVRGWRNKAACQFTWSGQK